MQNVRDIQPSQSFALASDLSKLSHPLLVAVWSNVEENWRGARVA
jgi:hypothetical protein